MWAPVVVGGCDRPYACGALWAPLVDDRPHLDGLHSLLVSLTQLHVLQKHRVGNVGHPRTVTQPGRRDTATSNTVHCDPQAVSSSQCLLYELGRLARCLRGSNTCWHARNTCPQRHAHLGPWRQTQCGLSARTCGCWLLFRGLSVLVVVKDHHGCANSSQLVDVCNCCGGSITRRGTRHDQ